MYSALRGTSTLLSQHIPCLRFGNAGQFAERKNGHPPAVMQAIKNYPAGAHIRISEMSNVLVLRPCNWTTSFSISVKHLTGHIGGKTLGLIGQETHSGRTGLWGTWHKR